MNIDLLVKSLKEQEVGAEVIQGVITKYYAGMDHKNGGDTWRKDTMPAGGYEMPGGRVLEGGPFSLINETVFNGLPVNSGGNAISRWIPSGKMKARKKEVQHLEFITPHGYDIENQTYAEWLATLDIGECGYGPHADWSGFRYQADGGSFSLSTRMLKQIEDGGLPYYESMPLGFGYDIVGANGSSMRIEDDAEWALALVMMMSEDHLNYVTTFGYKENSQMEWDGISAIVTLGYVEAHTVGRGIPHWANPLVIDGSGIVSAAELLSELHQMIRHIRRRAQLKNWTIAPGDIIVYMSSMMWDNLAHHIALGGVEQITSAYGVEIRDSYDAYLRRLQEVRNSGFGMGYIPIDGMPVYVLTDPNMGVDTTLDIGGSTSAAVTSDVFVLTRQAGNFQLWNHEFLDYSDLGGPRFDNETFGVQNGYGKGGYITEANKCYFYYMEMVGRMTCNMLPLQGRLTSVTIPVLSQYGNEAPGFYSQNFYPYKAHGSLQVIR
jgi:hypothetical protein